MRIDSVSAIAPATIANVACGFDVLGFAIDSLYDEVEAWRSDCAGVVIESVVGESGRLPTLATKNSAGIAAAALLERAGCDQGVRLILRKGLPLSSGLGSSAASAVAAVLAVSELLSLEASRTDLATCALEGERLGSGSSAADNVVASLYGGFVLARSIDPPDFVELPIPVGLSCAVVRPHLEIATRDQRIALGERVALRDAVTQWANLGAFVAGLYREDLELISRSLVDVVAEPHRAEAVPGFAQIRAAALANGALGCSLSGSGPSIFALCADLADAERAATAMHAAAREHGQDADRWVSAVGASGARITSRPFL